MQWIRNVSFVRRVTVGYGGCALTSGVALGGVVLATSGRPQVLPWVLVASVASLAWALAALFLTRSSIKESVESTVDAVVRMAAGDLETKIDSPGRDEISWLCAELNGMRKKLRTMVLQVRQSAEEVKLASGEIAGGNADLSTRTESQAAALQVTSGSMRQLADTLASNHLHSQEARQVVVQSAESAEQGARMMQEVVERMREINTSSSRIAEIIGVIDGIAFQTNILALNAAVEAARAGENGRGFAVVASEVRNLAQRSSTAAREIKTLIHDSSDKVSNGTRLVDDAGHNMLALRDRVRRVSELVEHIARAGESQTAEIGQAHEAVSRIDGMTQQNAALVEQISAAAHSLHGQSQQLAETLSTFRVAA
jgi:methyl-accepting chemotaxis protein